MIKQIVEHVRKHFGLAERKICKILGLSRSTVRYKSKKADDDAAVVEEMKEILEEHPNYGCQILGLKLRKQGRNINHKRVERLYRENNLQIKNRRKGRKKYRVLKRDEHLISTVPDEWIAMDFVIDSVDNRRMLKTLTMIDPVTKEAPRLKSGFSFNGKQVVEQLEELKRENKSFKYLQTDNGPEFRSYEVEQWCSDNGIKHVFSRPGKPTDNCFIESFNRILRNECLNVYFFPTLESAQQVIEEFRIDYNKERPQKGLKGLTPEQYRNKLLGRA